MGRALIKAVREEVMPILKADQSYTIDGIGLQLSQIFRRLNTQFSVNIVLGFAQQTAEQAVAKTAESNKSRFDKTVHAATGVDLGSIVATEGLEDFMELSISKNVSLIKSLPQEYLRQVEVIVNNRVTSGARFSTISKEIMGTQKSANKKLANRIKTIARNEIQTINSQITLRRSDSLGIKMGIFRTSQDERVRPCHAELNGKEYELAKGAWSKSCGRFIQPGNLQRRLPG